MSPVATTPTAFTSPLAFTLMTARFPDALTSTAVTFPVAIIPTALTSPDADTSMPERLPDADTSTALILPEAVIPTAVMSPDASTFPTDAFPTVVRLPPVNVATPSEMIFARNSSVDNDTTPERLPCVRVAVPSVKETAATSSRPDTLTNADSTPEKASALAYAVIFTCEMFVF